MKITKMPSEDAADLESPSQLRLDDRIYQDLLGRIHGGSYALGEKLPPEIELAEAFQVSRPVIRAALARLRETGLIVSKRGSGSYVSSGESGGNSGFSALSSIDGISDYFTFRRAIECESAKLAAQRPNPEISAAIQELLRSMDGEIEAGQATAERDIRFHGLIAEMSGNRFLVESLQMMRPHLLFVGRFVRSLSPSGYIRGKVSMQSEHHQIVDAILRGDADAASSLMDAHIRASENRVFKGE